MLRNKKTHNTISEDLSVNIDKIKNHFSYQVNNDFAIRMIEAKYNQKTIALCYYASLVNSDKIERSIIQPLLEQDGKTIINIVTAESIEVITNHDEISQNVTSGKVILFIDGSKQAYTVDVSDFQHRSIGQSENESVIRGPKEAFTESIHVNISLIRKRIRNENLVIEVQHVGERSKQDVQLMYIKDLVNEDLLADIRSRINDIKVDTVQNIELLEQYIEERPLSLFPTILYTERPDNACSYINRGHVIILMESSAACLIVPITFWDFFHNIEDRYSRFLFSNFARLIRFISLFITTMVSASYIALANFHSELIPVDLLLAIASARDKVPLPLFLEVLIMELAFELIREAGVRIPNPLGPTIGIVGALILGQAAVEANIISPIIVIISALSGLTSFAISDPSFNFTVRMTRFVLIFAAIIHGVYSLVLALTILLMYAASIKSFGVPYFAPLAPSYQSNADTYFRKPLRDEKWRPHYLLPKDLKKGSHNKKE
ncbi:spore germination protein [Amphibacillus xylanus]|uniref:Spore germination protein n=1 Tax=Amphibacillus xylanus (strain ATCC 51415 / DSM 6626 / JCM 7361 / LMG 17667 / NBRC 15112 / Ep01) TaxID=698758 RepID=K0J5I6_AMPXN|nr:spore germination protein [Amphibacillus xylanus]BAM46148.1 spore germination protein [Amphibacillus xylanus NBRC 15112]